MKDLKETAQITMESIPDDFSINPQEMEHPLCRSNNPPDRYYEKIGSVTLLLNGKNEEPYTITIYQNYIFSEEGQNLNRVRIEMTNDRNIFEVYFVEFDKNSFNEWKKKSHFNSVFQTFGNKLMQLMDLCVSKKSQYQATWKDSCISFSQILEFKTITITRLQFQQITQENDEDYIDQQAFHKYIVLISETRNQERKLQQLKEIVQKANPQLARQLRKNN